MTFTYRRTIFLGDTDAAGVVYFAGAMQMCHEAYEESLAVKNIKLQRLITENRIGLPIVNASINFFRPMFCGDRIHIDLIATQTSEQEFAVAYEVFFPLTPEKTLVRANTKHICINSETRQRLTLPQEIISWLNSYLK
jgi:1,4-dihydroxy-2-naphthoyl-CoA hydrolase